MKFILGTKEYMTQVFDDQGLAHPATVISAGPVTVTQVKTKEKDGYEAVQVAFGEKREALISKPQKGHFKGLGNFRYVEEFATPVGAIKTGDKVDLTQFKVGDLV
ncbi:MAG TPA: 50S ribosomal protein L3, partial [Candidatus Paceibacterota bacterium]|nr:50S ribosomal protein L3 [Candidatus Paceibacterota bacterium]